MRDNVPLKHDLGYLSAQLAEIWATWRESTFLYGDSKHLTETLVNAPASTWWDAEHPTQPDTLGPPLYPLLSLSGETDFTMGSLEAFNMPYMDGMMRNRSIGLVNREVLCEGGFDGWWSPVEKLIGCINYPNGTRAFIAQTLPWGGAVGGRVDTILKYVDHRNKRIVQDFLSTTPTLQPIIGECAKNTA